MTTDTDNLWYPREEDRIEFWGATFSGAATWLGLVGVVYTLLPRGDPHNALFYMLMIVVNALVLKHVYPAAPYFEGWNDER
jgi:uncharacterized membrane protein YbhN (UPF0104 family)